MGFVRWCRTTTERPAGLVPEAGGVASAAASKLELPDGTFLLRCEFSSEDGVKAAQALTGVTVLPALSTPADKLPAGVQTWLANRGVIIEPGDQVLNVLRKLRGVLGETFDISQRE